MATAVPGPGDESDSNRRMTAGRPMTDGFRGKNVSPNDVKNSVLSGRLSDPRPGRCKGLQTRCSELQWGAVDCSVPRSSAKLRSSIKPRVLVLAHNEAVFVIEKDGKNRLT